MTLQSPRLGRVFRPGSSLGLPGKVSAEAVKSWSDHAHESGETSGTLHRSGFQNAAGALGPWWVRPGGSFFKAGCVQLEITRREGSWRCGFCTSRNCCSFVAFLSPCSVPVPAVRWAGGPPPPVWILTATACGSCSSLLRSFFFEITELQT